jgi:hypothetical protein
LGEESKRGSSKLEIGNSKVENRVNRFALRGADLRFTTEAAAAEGKRQKEEVRTKS